MLSYVVYLAETMGYKLIVEGIETEDERDLLLDLGCEFGQGYYYSKPLKEIDFIDFLDNVTTGNI